MQRDRRGLARIPLLSYGFRPFFLGGAIWAAVAMALWIGELSGAWSFAEAYGPVAWHAHSLLFGYVTAIVAGFLLTAIPNWTGRLPVRGGPLLALFILWIAGRLALLCVDRIGIIAAILVDSSFLLVFALVILREIAAGRNWKNLKTVALLLLMAASNIGFHLEVLLDGSADISIRAGTAAIIGMIMLIGGRITPSFTRNWLVRSGAAALPAPFGRYDVVTLAVSGLGLAFWILAPTGIVTGSILLAAAGLQLIRLWRWAGRSTWQEPLVLILHVGYLFVPLGFALVGASILRPAAIPAADALHAWTVGAVAVMTIAVMTRATLGHTGRDLVASPLTRMIYFTLVTAVVCRLAVPFAPGATMPLLTLAAIGWIAGFLGFATVFGPMLLRSRLAS
ncbi:MAG: NnrS family protein [Bauldia sp.]|uniref:NnrS family protein n=1 Tax=Bauldia sp. TaxID=2575872 RepID=UPI001DDEDA37|nr:NnrS family protein [Bauldia sp.]MCB1494357.1 NnrS family protein [Bauldia sp.]